MQNQYNVTNNEQELLTSIELLNSIIVLIIIYLLLHLLF
jgi:hypothetical protein